MSKKVSIRANKHLIAEVSPDGMESVKELELDRRLYRLHPDATARVDFKCKTSGYLTKEKVLDTVKGCDVLDIRSWTAYTGQENRFIYDQWEVDIRVLQS